MKRSQAGKKILSLPQDPVFIVGYPRSGTTLLQRFLAAQPGFYSFPETHYFSVIERRIRLDGDGRIAASDLGALLQAIREKTESDFHEHEIAILYQEAEAGALTSKRLFEFLISRFLAPQIQAGGEALPWRWVEKTPTHANFLERIIHLYPLGQILHIVRHPVPAILSRKRNFPFNRETPLTKLAQDWNHLLNNVERGRRKFPGHILSLHYEDLVGDPHKSLQAVGAFLERPFDSVRIGRVRTDGLPLPPALAAEKWKLKDTKLELANTNGSYRDTASQQDVEVIESIVGEKMKEYGYVHFS
jgi:hypothetical protein